MSYIRGSKRSQTSDISDINEVNTKKKPFEKFSNRMKRRYARWESYFMPGPKRNFLRFAALIMSVVIFSMLVNYAPCYKQEVSKNILFQKYNQNFVHLDKVSNFRNELTDDESNADFDNDGLKNVDEITGRSSIYRKDTDGNGVIDGYTDSLGNDDFFSAITEEGIYDNSYINQLSKVSGCSKVEYEKSPTETSSNSKTVAVSYNGGAFDGFTLLSKPFRIYNYSGYVSLYSKKIKSETKKSIKYNNSGKDKLCYILAISYDIEKDEYSCLGSRLSYNGYDEYYDYSEYDFYRCHFSIENDNPIALVKMFCDTDEDISDKVKNYSFKYSVLLNQYSGKKANGAYINKALDDNGKYLIFGEDYTITYNDYPKMLRDFSKSGLGRNCRFMPSSYKQALLDRQTNNPDYPKNAAHTFWNNMIFANVSNENPEFFEGKSYASIIKYVAKAKNENIKKINTKSKGNLSVTSTDFDITKDTFSFGNFTSDNARNGVIIGMADIASNYFNYRTLPSFDGVDTASVYSELKNNGIGSKAFVVPSKEFDFPFFLRDSVTNACGDNTLISLLEKQTENDHNAYFSKYQKHSNTKSVIDKLGEYLKNKKTVVAYMRSGNRISAVVVYAMIQSDIDPYEYTLYVYDPNYPMDRVIASDVKNSDVTQYEVNHTIKIRMKPLQTLDVKKGVMKSSLTFTFEYGLTADYHFGNSGYLIRGIKYSGGDICFKVPDDLSKNNTVRFIN